jgi:hypothetical protein
MKQVNRDNYHVVVYTPAGQMWTHLGHDEMMRRSKELAAQVDRHCDGEGKAEVRFETTYTCSHCQRPWTEKNDVYNACCDENVKEAEAVEFDFDAFEAGE